MLCVIESFGTNLRNVVYDVATQEHDTGMPWIVPATATRMWCGSGWRPYWTSSATGYDSHG